MPYPIEDDRERLVDLLPPNERLLYDALERQIQQTQLVLRALLVAKWWAVITGLALAASVLAQAAAHIWG